MRKLKVAKLSWEWRPRREKVLWVGLASGVSSWAYCRVGATSAPWALKGSETSFQEELLWLKIWDPLTPARHTGLGFCYPYYLITPLKNMYIWFLKRQPKWEDRIDDVLSTFIPAGLLSPHELVFLEFSLCFHIKHSRFAICPIADFHFDFKALCVNNMVLLYTWDLLRGWI